VPFERVGGRRQQVREFGFAAYVDV
jgi:hypothetical protein